MHDAYKFTPERIENTLERESVWIWLVVLSNRNSKSQNHIGEWLFVGTHIHRIANILCLMCPLIFYTKQFNVLCPHTHIYKMWKRKMKKWAPKCSSSNNSETNRKETKTKTMKIKSKNTKSNNKKKCDRKTQRDGPTAAAAAATARKRGCPQSTLSLNRMFGQNMENKCRISRDTAKNCRTVQPASQPSSHWCF